MLSNEAATALRLQEEFPSLPEHVRARQRYLAVDLDVCVSTQGDARAERFRSPVDPEVRRVVGKAIASWRYRPLVSEGVARAFCHRLSLQYHRE